MTININEEKIVELANELGLSPWPIEKDEGSPIAFYIDRDIEDTSLYNMARVTVEPDSEEVVAHCGLYNAKGAVSSDKAKTYPSIEVAIKDIKDRFDHLRAPYQPTRKKVEKKVPRSTLRYIH